MQSLESQRLECPLSAGHQAPNCITIHWQHNSLKTEMNDKLKKHCTTLNFKWLHYSTKYMDGSYLKGGLFTILNLNTIHMQHNAPFCVRVLLFSFNRLHVRVSLFSFSPVIDALLFHMGDLCLAFNDSASSTVTLLRVCDFSCDGALCLRIVMNVCVCVNCARPVWSECVFLCAASIWPDGGPTRLWWTAWEGRMFLAFVLGLTHLQHKQPSTLIHNVAAHCVSKQHIGVFINSKVA